MVVETRSQRQAQLQRPPYPSFTNPQHTGETHSVFQSSSSSLSSESSIASPSAALSTTMMMQDPSSPDMMLDSASSHQPPPFSGAQAPLPSPTDGSCQPTSYFGSIDQQSQSAAAAASQMAYAPQHRFPASQGPTAGHGAGCAGPSSYVGQRGNEGGVPETAPFLQDFNLVAEAAKRAQMACLERDLGECGL
ncbi:hypothetical protein KC318_g13683 [Hortaea werneckii]|uniref:Uncharacterized protein n=1 Tax=Hortaea werneckii TaxID=91943 RepID=A0A3M6ZSS8_HORWE|nr:hypothetical protein KC334_g13939 [Hortaea werneckii]KAI6919867.1 hypothetical protein KC355_g17317 [Hortaea werneckii]KAI7654293.1 hypothetical protein KC318_g13683 [Hortaea werneckii]RMX93136.1 hypothetical protein D0867_14316 [Hortaea werneckii]RMY18305.1 hypothetical protein D0866_13216 [Hortaea werneckii]